MSFGEQSSRPVIQAVPVGSDDHPVCEVLEPAELRATIAAEGTKMAQRNAP